MWRSYYWKLCRWSLNPVQGSNQGPDLRHGEPWGLTRKREFLPFGLILDTEHSRTFRFAFIASPLLFRILLFALVMTTQLEYWSTTKGVSQTCSQQLHDHASNSMLLTPTTNLSVIPHTLHSSICSPQGLIFSKEKQKSNLLQGRTTDGVIFTKLSNKRQKSLLSKNWLQVINSPESAYLFDMHFYIYTYFCTSSTGMVHLVQRVPRRNKEILSILCTIWYKLV